MDGHALGHRTLSPAVRRGLRGCAGCGLGLAILAVAAASWAATYRWVDEQGRVHYGDSIPPQYANQGHVELNGQGRVTKRVGRAPSSAEARQQRERQTAREEAEEHEARERQRHDNALLATFSDAREIELAKQRALDQEQAMLDSLLIMRRHSESKLESQHINDMIRMRQQNMEAIRARFAADKARYLELTGGR